MFTTKFTNRWKNRQR